MLVALFSVTLLPAGADAASRPAKAPRLKAFASCASLVGYARHNAARTRGGAGVPTRAPGLAPQVLAAPQVGPGVAVADAQQQATSQAGAAPPAAPEVARTQGFSQTNVQELGIDEPDVVKTDGRRLFAIANGALHAFDVTSGTPQPKGSLALEGTGHQLFLRGDRVLVMASSGREHPIPLGRPVADSITPSPEYSPPQVLLTEVDVSDAAAMAVRRTETLDGTFVDGRLSSQGTARLVVASAPRPVELPRLRRAGVRTWVPRTVFRSRISKRTLRRQVAPCTAVRRPPEFSGLDLLTVFTYDLDKGLYSADRDAVLAGAQTVYASPGALYVASQRYVRALEAGRSIPEAMRTEIHRFDTSDPQRTTYASSGSVPGFVLNQYAMSEHEGALRVASTTTPEWFQGRTQGSSQSYVTVLRHSDKALAQIGRVGGLGHGERIYAVRFLGDEGFVVTFRQVDPLYTLDLSQPTAPKVMGELKIEGYSAYLHPVGAGRLLGVGRDATAEGRVKGVQLSLFDVSDLRQPARLAQTALGDGSSTDAEFDPHAFLFWDPTGLAVLPVQQYDARGGSTSQFAGVVGFRVGKDSLSEAGRAQHPAEQGSSPPIARTVVVGERLFTVSYAGIGTSRLDTLAAVDFVRYAG